MTGLSPATGAPAGKPVEERLADGLGEAQAGRGQVRPAAARLLRRLGSYDRAAYGWVARQRTPLLDAPVRRASELADFSKPWIVVAGLCALLGGRPGRRAARTGLAAVGATSLVVNLPMKMAGQRHRPDRERLGVSEQRWTSMPSSRSFPSGHSASAAAFTVAVGDVLPALRLPLRAAASVVAFSRVYTGVHYPSDVLAGAAVGALLGRRVSRASRRRRSP